MPTPRPAPGQPDGAHRLIGRNRLLGPAMPVTVPPTACARMAQHAFGQHARAFADGAMRR